MSNCGSVRQTKFSPLVDDDDRIEECIKNCRQTDCICIVRVAISRARKGSAERVKAQKALHDLYLCKEEHPMGSTRVADMKAKWKRSPPASIGFYEQDRILFDYQD